MKNINEMSVPEMVQEIKRLRSAIKKVRKDKASNPTAVELAGKYETSIAEMEARIGSVDAPEKDWAAETPEAAMELIQELNDKLRSMCNNIQRKKSIIKAVDDGEKPEMAEVAAVYKEELPALEERAEALRQKITSGCPCCGGDKEYSSDFDAMFCPVCNIWLDVRCGDEMCDFCSRRPERPMVSLAVYEQANGLGVWSKEYAEAERVREDGVIAFVASLESVIGARIAAIGAGSLLNDKELGEARDSFYAALKSIPSEGREKCSSKTHGLFVAESEYRGVIKIKKRLESEVELHPRYEERIEHFAKELPVREKALEDILNSFNG